MLELLGDAMTLSVEEEALTADDKATVVEMLAVGLLHVKAVERCGMVGLDEDADRTMV